MKTIDSTLSDNNKKVKLLIIKTKNFEKHQEIVLFIIKIDLIIFMLIFNNFIQGNQKDQFN